MKTEASLTSQVFQVALCVFASDVELGFLNGNMLSHSYWVLELLQTCIWQQL